MHAEGEAATTKGPLSWLKSYLGGRVLLLPGKSCGDFTLSSGHLLRGKVESRRGSLFLILALFLSNESTRGKSFVLSQTHTNTHTLRRGSSPP